MDFDEIMGLLRDYQCNELLSEEKYNDIDTLLESIKKFAEKPNIISFEEWYRRFYHGLYEIKYHKPILYAYYDKWCKENGFNPKDAGI